MSDIVCRIESISTEVALVIIAIVGAWSLGTECKDLLIAIGGGLVGYLTRAKSNP